MPEQPGPNLAYVPELLELIGHHLTVPQLALCTRICKFWHQALTPLLWETFDDSLYQWPRILSNLYCKAPSGLDQKNRAWLDGLFAKHGHSIRTLRVRWYATVLAATECGVCTQLVSLQTLSFTRESVIKDTQGWSDADAATVLPILKDIIRPSSWSSKQELLKNIDVGVLRRLWTLIYDNSSTLRSLRLDHSLRKMCSSHTLGGLDSILVGLRNLEELSNLLYPTNLDLLLQRLPKLRSIRGDFRHKVSTPYRGIRSLESTSALDPPSVRLYLQKFPNLNSLSMDQLVEVPQTPTTALPQQVQVYDTSYQLKKFHFTNPQGLLVSGSAKRVITWLPYLTHITLQILLPETAEHLAEHCRHLESFRQVDDVNTYRVTYITNTVIKLLGACPNLKVLDTIQHRITANALLTNPPWVCHGLQTFRCRIVGIPRLTESDCKALFTLTSYKSSSNVSLTPQVRHALKMNKETMELQQRILERLARLTRLKVLELSFKVPGYLGRHNGYVDFNVDTLALTLDSGLDRLAALRDLEIFGFEGCYHAIGQPELQWMIQSWPRLQAMRGLLENALPESPFEVRKASLRRYMKQHRPNIQLLGKK